MYLFFILGIILISFILFGIIYYIKTHVKQPITYKIKFITYGKQHTFKCISYDNKELCISTCDTISHITTCSNGFHLSFNIKDINETLQHLINNHYVLNNTAYRIKHAYLYKTEYVPIERIWSDISYLKKDLIYNNKTIYVELKNSDIDYSDTDKLNTPDNIIKYNSMITDCISLSESNMKLECYHDRTTNI